jgi:hypothetical protein
MPMELSELKDNYEISQASLKTLTFAILLARDAIRKNNVTNNQEMNEASMKLNNCITIIEQTIFGVRTTI